MTGAGSLSACSAKDLRRTLPQPVAVPRPQSCIRAAANRATVHDGVQRYFAARRHKVAGLVDRNFSLRGSLRPLFEVAGALVRLAARSPLARRRRTRARPQDRVHRVPIPATIAVLCSKRHQRASLRQFELPIYGAVAEEGSLGRRFEIRRVTDVFDATNWRPEFGSIGCDRRIAVQSALQPGSARPDRAGKRPGPTLTTPKAPLR